MNGLVGYIGGYIGLILGYSLLQIPDFILLLRLKAKKYFGKRKFPTKFTSALTYPQEKSLEKYRKIMLGLSSEKEMQTIALNMICHHQTQNLTKFH